MDAPTTAAGLRARGGLKWGQYGPDVLAAWVAEMDFGLAPPVATALHDAVDRGDTGYFHPDLTAATARAASACWAERLGWHVGPERVFPVPDVVEGIRRAIVHLTRPGSPVVLHAPVYHPFFDMVDRAGRELVEVACRPDREGRYRLDLPAIEAALESGAGCVVLCNPWNPTGRSLTTEEVGAVLETAAAHDARVIADEVHALLTYPGNAHVVAAGLDPSTVVTVTSASKAWNLPGLKCAQVVLTRDADVERWEDYFTVDKVGVSTFGLVANEAAYAHGGVWLDEVMAVLDENRGLVGSLLADRLPQIRYHPPEATYLAWLDFRDTGLDDPAEHVLRRAGVALTPGAPFGTGGTGHARLNFATWAPILVEMVERMAAAI